MRMEASDAALRRARPDEGDIPELLAPAGGPAAFDAALAGGADAIYVGYGQELNARRGAESLEGAAFSDHVRKAHLAGTRVYVTANIVVKDEEMPRALARIREAWVRGADAFIIQDLGLVRELRMRWPEMEIHASTQMNVHDSRGTLWCRDQGMTRVTLSRELSLAELAAISQTGVETEGFGHGALCFCYSGICLMSSTAGGRSANRGMCAQPCRLLYDLVDGEGELLSRPGWDRPLCPRDNCTVDHLAALRDAGLGSLKVEGRLKAPDYVLSVASAYREALDAVATGKGLDGQRRAAIEDLLRRSFNRDFTDAYLMGRSGNEMMSFERSNNRGELVGTVVSSRDLGSARVRRGGERGGRERFRTMTRAEVVVELTRPVGAGDLLEIRPADDPAQFLTGLAASDAGVGERIVVRTARPMPSDCPVRVIRSERALAAAARVDAACPRRREVAVRVVARFGEPLVVELEAGDRGPRASAEGPVVEAARTKSLSCDELREHVCRMGSTPFEPSSFSCELDEGVGMSFSVIHRVRAEACARLAEAVLEPWEGRGEGLAAAPDADDLAAELASVVRSVPTRAPRGEDVVGTGSRQVEVCALVTSPAAAAAARAAGATRVYATADDLAAHEGWDDAVIPWLDEVCREGDHDRLDPWVRTGAPVSVGNLSELALAGERGAFAEVRPTVPAHNASTLALLRSCGAEGAWLSGELSLAELCGLARQGSELGLALGLVVLGRERAMTSEHCVLQVADGCCGDCGACPLRRRELFLRDKDGALWPVRTDLQGRSRIYAPRLLDATPQMGELVEAGICRLMVDATLMGDDEASSAVRRVMQALADARAGRRPAPRLAGATSGHLFAPIA